MYNGHKSRAYWNVSLWINNDESLYDFARECVRHTRTRDEAAKRMLTGLQEIGVTKTRDGYAFSAAMVGM